MDLYKIGIALSMTSNASEVMGALSHRMHLVDRQATHLQDRFSRLNLAVGGAMSAMAGTVALTALGKMVDRGNELIRVQQGMAQAGVKATEIQEAYAKSWEMTRKYANVGASEILKVISEARMTFGSQHEATHHVEDFVRMISFLKAFEGGRHGAGAANFEAEAVAAMKSGEIAGKITPQDMAEHVRQLTAMRVAYGDQLKITQYLTAQRHAGVALRNTSDDFRYGMFPALVQENGQNAGTMLMTAFQKVVAGTGNKTAAVQHMADIGLLKDDQVKYDKNGRVIGLKDPSAIINNQEAAMNFGDWVMKTLKPLLDNKLEGLTGDDRNRRQSQLIANLFPDRNVQKVITEVVQQYSKFQKDAAQMAAARKALNESEYLDKSWVGQKQAFHEQWNNFVEALGAPMVKNATETLRSVNGVLSDMAQWAAKPEMAANVVAIGKALGVASVALVGAGATALLAAIGPAGWLVGGIIALGGAFAAFHPEALNAAVSAVTNTVRSIYESVKGVATDPKVLAQVSAFWQGAKGYALEIYTAAKGFVLSPEFLDPLKEFWKTTVTEAKGIVEFFKAGFADPKTGETIRGTLTTTMTEIRSILDWYRSAKEYLASVLGEGTGKLFDLKSLGLDANGDILGQLSTKLRESLIEAGKAVADGAEALAAEIKSWPGKLASAIAEMGAGIVSAISSMFSSLISRINPFSRTSFEGGGGGGGLGGLLQSANYSPGGGLGGGGGGGGGPIPAVPAGLGMSDHERNNLGLILRYESGGRNVMNYIGDRRHTAQGYYQITNTNWRRLAPALGIRARSAMDASLEDQTRVAMALMRQSGMGNWSNFNPRLRGALHRGERAQTGVPHREVPAVSAPPRHQEQPITLNVHLDGKRIHQSVMSRVVAQGRFPTSAGQADGYGVHLPSSTSRTDV